MITSTHITITISRGWLTTIGAAGIGMMLGILYVWSVIKSGIPASWGWSHADKALPYSVMAVSFSMAMMPAGMLQDRFGPRLVITIGGFLTGLGCIICGFGDASLPVYIVGFGLITGSGVGFAYSALAPAAMKWFPPEKTGLIVGIVVSGSGLAPLILAPISAWTLSFFETTTPYGIVEQGVAATMIVLGLVIWVVIGMLICLIQRPPIGFIPRIDQSPERQKLQSVSMTWSQMVSTSQFWLLFCMFFAGSSTGLIFIGVAAELGKSTLGKWAFLAVIVISIGNTAGRIVAGLISDKIGRLQTLLAEFICQGCIVSLLFWAVKSGSQSWVIIMFILFMIGLNYGANHALFPSACRDYYGIRNFGLNYGILFSAFGSAGLIMPWLNGMLQDITGKPNISFIVIIIMMAVSALLAVVSIKIGKPRARESS